MGDIGRSLRFRVLARDGFTCRYCGAKSPDVVLHVDHIHPKSQGGANTIENLVTACFDCNMGKRDRVMSPDTVEIVAPMAVVAVGRRTTAPAVTRLPTKTNWGDLEGKFIHVCGEDGKVHRQGRIVAMGDRYATVEWFDWLIGSGGTRTLEVLDDLVKLGIYIYANDEAMREAWDYGMVPRQW